MTARTGSDAAFGRFFKAITGREAGKDGNSAIALSCVRTMQCAWRSANRSKKYLLTLGEILDYLKGGERTLWDKPMKIIYLAPAKLAAKLRSPHVRCAAALEKAAEDLAAMDDGYSQFLAGILKGVLERDPASFGSAECG